MASPEQLAELGIAAPRKDHASRLLPPTPRATYRTLLHCLRFIRDPHIWLIASIRFRTLLHEANKQLPAHLKDGSPELEVCKEQRERAWKHLKTELNEVRAASACHPHALTRLIEECYGVRGRVKWELIKNVTLSTPLKRNEWPQAVLDKVPDPETRYPPMTLQPLPPCLRPLSKKRPDEQPVPRARTILPPAAVRRVARKDWEWAWANVSVPVVFPENEDGAATGWEGKGVIETMRQLAGLESPPAAPTPPRRAGVVTLRGPRDPPPSFQNLPNSLQAAFPRRSPRSYRPLPPFPPPRASLTRSNPQTWKYPRKLTARLIRRVYKSVWDRLDWVAKVPLRKNSAGVVIGGWQRSDSETVLTGSSRGGPAEWRDASSRWVEAGEADLKWLTEDEVEGNWDAKRLRAAKQKAEAKAVKRKAPKDAESE
ncbi:hypothetical protein CC85DRAFT_282726 [Cutaneotrichosporon oleaginosum]|uniref:LYR motif-containing protein Cup1-like N-terminal domain-containing protein n=1 Tax=Cutaneotrichosporon oleaginosum TaxID=879819 RepID=A0A0J0XVX8_9TREE|nr:uncharacterized protein CC85DRAFT_282726 [Cutaneotrichosporon oleaginosum]KLT45237.1 hypothetical protein CC85DRAFT_282726 [Cutaneotrichosporon oleaginosum]TXT14931.1 hypothetical protein COLE_01124 [Cutaneotrichosporon oleaginosum]